jgi:hypothetical protein
MLKKILLASLALHAVFACSLAEAGALADGQQLATAHGTLSIAEVAGKTDRLRLLLDGRQLLEFAAIDAVAKRLSSSSQPEYVLIDASMSGLYCTHQYYIVQLNADRSTRVSEMFGECRQLIGVHAQAPGLLIELAATGPAQDALGTYEEWTWDGRRLRQRGKLTPVCTGLHVHAMQGQPGQHVKHTQRAVGGQGRLRLHSAPDDSCRLNQLFLVPGDRVAVLAEHDGFAYIDYRQRRGGRSVKGWVARERLALPDARLRSGDATD